MEVEGNMEHSPLNTQGYRGYQTFVRPSAILVFCNHLSQSVSFIFVAMCCT